MAGIPGAGPGSQVVHGGAETNGAALTSPAPTPTVDTARPTAVAAHAIMCLTFIVRPPPRSRYPLRCQACPAHGGKNPGIPPPPRGFPPPERPYLQHFSAGMPGAGPPGSGWTAGTPGGGSAGAALTIPSPLVSVEMPTPAAIAATAAARFRFMVRVPPQTFTTLVTSCLAGYAEIPTVTCHRLAFMNFGKANSIRDQRLLRGAK
jgi:hypothetical protein